MDEVRTEIKALLAKPDVCFAEVLAVCLRYAHNEAWCSQLSDRDHTELMALIGRLATWGTQR